MDSYRACNFVVRQFSFAPGAASDKASGEVLDFCNGVLESVGSDKQLTGQTVRKSAHFSEFLVLGALAAAALLAHGFRHWQLLAPAVFLPVAVIDECIQIFTPDRGPGVLDVAIDFMGGAVGVLVFWGAFFFVNYIINRRKEKISKTT